MVAIASPSCIWMQLCFFFFSLSSLFSDLLIIRLLLLVAYCFLLVGGALGFPTWPSVGSTGKISLDGVIWFSANVLFNAYATLRLLVDERCIVFKDEEQEQLWRLFYRRGGMGRLEFLPTWQRCRLQRFKAGEEVLSQAAARRTLVLVVEGLATFTVQAQGPSLVRAASCKGGLQGEQQQCPAFKNGASGTLHSGSCFDMGLLNVLGIFVALETDPAHPRHVVADTDCLVALWDLADLNFLATSAGPAVGQAWRNFALCQLGLAYRLKSYGEPVNARNEMEAPEVLSQGARSSDLTDPLDEVEDPPRSWRSALAALQAAFTVNTPPGVRHVGLPVHGAQARRRVQSILKATGRQAVSRRSMEILINLPPDSLWHNIKARPSSS